MNIIYIALGGILGACLRYGSIRIMQLNKITHIANIPINIIIVNIIGSFLFGLFLYLVKIWHVSDSLKMFIFTGFLASYTTYSTFIYEFSLLCSQKNFYEAIIYLLASFLIPFLIMVFFLLKL